MLYLYGIGHVYILTFGITLFFFKNNKMLHRLNFSNRLFILFVLPYEKPKLSILWEIFNYEECLTCYTLVLLSSLHIKECVTLARPMRNQDIVNCSFLDFLKAGFHFPYVRFIRKSLLCMLLFQCCCQLYGRIYRFCISSQYMEFGLCRGPFLKPIWLPSLIFLFTLFQGGLTSSILSSLLS